MKWSKPKLLNLSQTGVAHGVIGCEPGGSNSATACKSGTTASAEYCEVGNGADGGAYCLDGTANTSSCTNGGAA
jgi:hypothetical protein